jgi:hypothetical protein
MRRRLAVSDVSGHAVGPAVTRLTPQQKAEITCFVGVAVTAVTGWLIAALFCAHGAEH